MPTLPAANLTELPPQGQIAQSAPADVAAYLGCAGAGTNFAIVPIGPQYLTGAQSTFANGPLLEEGGYILNKTPIQSVHCKVPATAVSAVASAPVYVGGGTAASFVVGGTILDGFDVVLLVTTGGTLGTSFSYKISLDGGSTYGNIVASGATVIIPITGTLNGVSIATGITLTLTSTQTVVLNDTISFWTTPASASILTTTITRVASSTSTLVFSGTPKGEYQILVQFLTAGTEGAGNTITFWVSLDGGLNFGAVQQLNTGGTYAIPDGAGSSGITLTVGAGTISALDQVTANTTAPVPAFADVQTAMNAIRNWSGSWAFFMLCGRSTRAMRDSIEALQQTYATSGRFTWCAISGRDRIAGENVAASLNNVLGDTAWANRIITEWGTSAGNRTPPYFGSAYVTSPLPGARQNRKSVALGYVGRQIGITPDTDPGDRTLPNGGALSSDTLITAPTSGAITPTNAGSLVEHDARLNPSLFGINGNVVRTYYGETGLAPGVFPAGGRLMSASTDIQRSEHRRVLNLAEGALYAAMTGNLLRKLPINPATMRAPYAPGDINPATVVAITQLLFLAVRNAVGLYVSSGSLPNGKGGITVTLNPTPAIVGGNTTVYQTTQLVWKDILDTFTGTIGFVNPALQATTQAA